MAEEINAQNAKGIRADFSQIDALGFNESFDYCEAMARDIIEPLLDSHDR